MTNAVKKGRKKSRGIVRRSAKTIFAFFYGMPIVWIILTSFKQETDVFSTQSSLFFSPTLSTYRKLLPLVQPSLHFSSRSQLDMP